jgi:TPR repeat protein
LILYPGKYATILEISLVATPCAAFPERDLIVKTISVLWITVLVLGYFLINGNRVQAEEDKLLTMCNEGNSVACFKRGQKYVTLDKDTKKAIPLFRKSCAADHMTACLWGGNLIQNTGKQYSPEWKEAAAMFKKACEAGEDGGCFNLGSLYYKEGRARKAKKLYKKACNMGNKIGCDNVEWLSK